MLLLKVFYLGFPQQDLNHVCQLVPNELFHENE